MMHAVLPLIRILLAVINQALAAALKFKTIVASKAILLALAAGVLESKVNCAVLVKNG
jgi:hypothetical protein|tara:strand:- start:307 stop:480 length:174 start_codon:yes stop_codon:yes gene_type:complete